MKRFPKILAATCTALVLSSSLAMAAEAPNTSKAAPAMPAHAAQALHGSMPGSMPGQMGLAGLSPEKQELARTIMNAHRDALFPLRQSMYAKSLELEALNAAGNGDSGKAKAVIREIADLNAKMLMENGTFRARLVKETGLRTAPMGPGMMSGGMMAGGGMKCAMMEQMMSQMNGGMAHGAANGPGAGMGAGPGANMGAGMGAGMTGGAVGAMPHNAATTN
ncbi:MAG: hypothetical protein CVU73_03915 [Deltaproteobacteria bacterium HGW-Deltaproteobacteria-8]|jgi:hypothetical protein|nr:MAG: hypothetical protein CVU73_03915 [Deltaproteobacteria bacterium HGW-Deltaproteobacteria-8]